MEWTSLAGNKKVYIWGAWEVGYDLQKRLESLGIEVTAYLDGKLAGVTFHDKPVFGTDKLAELGADPRCFVFVACAEHPAILKSLREAGFTEGENMLYLGNAFTVATSSPYYADSYGNEMRTGSVLPSFTVGMCGSIRVGNDVQIGDDVKLIAWGGAKLIIGDHVKIGDHTVLEVRDCGIMRIGDSTSIGSNVTLQCKHGGSICLGKRVIIEDDCELFCLASDMQIGDHVMFNKNFSARFCHASKFRCGKDSTFAYQVKLRGENGHTIIDLANECVHPNRKDVVIGDHVWVGMGASLLGGTVIGRDSIVGADALVTKEFPANSLVAGSPAKVIREQVTWDMKPDISYEEWILKQ